VKVRRSHGAGKVSVAAAGDEMGGAAGADAMAEGRADGAGGATPPLRAKTAR